MKKNIKRILVIIIISIIAVMGVFLIKILNSENKVNINNPLIEEKVDPLTSFFEGKKITEYIFSPREFKKLDTNKLFDEYYFSSKQTALLDLKLNSNAYVLVDLDNRDILYGQKYDEIIFPASLTKLITLDTILNLCDDLNETSYITSLQQEELIKENASIAYIDVDKEYTIKDLLYALVLPSGADAAKALENYALSKGLDLVGEMNKRCVELGCMNTHLTNTTGLHDEMHYLSLIDYLRVVKDLLNYQEGENVLSTFEYTLATGEKVKSTLYDLSEIENPIVCGGKTGFTSYAGQCVCVFYKYNLKNYLLVLAGANGNPSLGEKKHFDDVRSIFEYLYS